MVFTITRENYLRKFNQEIEVSTGTQKQGTFTSLVDDRYEGGNAMPEGIPQLKSSDYDGYDDDIDNLIIQHTEPVIRHNRRGVPEEGLGSQSVRQGEVSSLEDTTLRRRGKTHTVPKEETLNNGLHLQTLQEETSDRPFDDEGEGLNPKLDYPLILKKEEL